MKRESKRFPGLFLESHGSSVTVSYGVAWTTYSLITGEMVDCSDHGEIPSAMEAHARDTIRQMVEKGRSA